MAQIKSKTPISSLNSNLLPTMNSMPKKDEIREKRATSAQRKNPKI
jgi:hypothetical protein